MKTSILSAMIFLLMAISGAAHAVRTAQADVVQVFASSDGGGLVTIGSNLDTTGAVCSSNSRYQIDPASAGAKGHLATLLTAKASGAQIQMDVGDCLEFPEGLVSPVILNVILK